MLQELKQGKFIQIIFSGTNIRVTIADHNRENFQDLKKTIEDVKNIQDYKTKENPEETIKEICTW